MLRRSKPDVVNNDDQWRLLLLREVSYDTRLEDKSCVSGKL